MKPQIRKEMVAKRRGLLADKQRDEAENLASHLLPWLDTRQLDGRAVIAGYHPTNGELSPLPALAALTAKGYGLALPCVENEERILAFRRWQPSDELAAGPYNIKQPLASAALLQPTILLVPMVAADKELNRLGYGGGYYDQTIAHLRSQNPNVLAIGLAYDFQLLDSLLAEEHDVPMDVVFTPSGKFDT